MKRIALVVIAFFTILGLSPMAALAATLPTVSVSQDSMNATLNVLSSCGTHTPGLSDYKPPATPSNVTAAVADDRVSGMTRDAGSWLTANSLPMVNFTKHITRTYETPWGPQTVAGIGHVWHAYIPGYNGTSCSVWTLVSARDF